MVVTRSTLDNILLSSEKGPTDWRKINLWIPREGRTCSFINGVWHHALEYWFCPNGIRHTNVSIVNTLWEDFDSVSNLWELDTNNLKPKIIRKKYLRRKEISKKNQIKKGLEMRQQVRRRGKSKPMSLLKEAVLRNAKNTRISGPFTHEVFHMLMKPRFIPRRENLLKYHLRSEKRGYSFSYQSGNIYRGSKALKMDNNF